MSIVNDKPTPETDEQFKSFPAYFEIDLFCRKLERERDEAREAFVIATDQMVIAQSNLREVNKERDEARAALEYIAYSNRSALHIEDYAKEFLARIK
jgi:predicted house-cleaning NTP pyrophosphatase (Maf/HAM1 superfamily)